MRVWSIFAWWKLSLEYVLDLDIVEILIFVNLWEKIIGISILQLQSECLNGFSHGTAQIVQRTLRFIRQANLICYKAILKCSKNFKKAILGSESYLESSSASHPINLLSRQSIEIKKHQVEYLDFLLPKEQSSEVYWQATLQPDWFHR